MNVYVASSWRNLCQSHVVMRLRNEGHDVYDFKDADGFHWTEVDPEWLKWTPESYLEGLKHPCAERGFNRDMTALKECDACIYVMPCGVSASLEAGWARGANKRLFVYVPELREPDLMIKMAELVTTNIEDIVAALRIT